MLNVKQDTSKIVVTGPESSGKTQLAQALANANDAAAYVPEFARSYLNHLNRPYTRADLEFIGRGQAQWEAWYVQQHPQLLVCDTDWTVLQIWEHFRFGQPTDQQWSWKKGYQNPQPANLYLLCVPDFPWAYDPLREHPEQREELFVWYTDLMEKHKLPYEAIRGPLQDRLTQALGLVRKLL